MRCPNVTGLGDAAYISPNGYAAGSFTNCIFDGLSGAKFLNGGGATFPIAAGQTVIINGVTVMAPGGGWANMAAVVSAINSNGAFGPQRLGLAKPRS